MPQIIEVEQERFHDIAPRLPLPDAAYSLGSDDPEGCGNGMDVLLVYEFKEAA